jgi:tetratricopeptide (TPR) repeat protein
MRPRSAWFVPLLLLATCRSGDVKVAFEPGDPDPAEVARQRDDDRAFLGGFVPGKLTQPVVDAFLRFNRLSVSLSPQFQEVEQAASNLRHAIRKCLEGPAGPEELRRVQLHLLSRFDAELRNLMQLRVPGAPSAFLTGAPPPPAALEAFLKFAEVGGDFLPTAALNGLIVQGGSESIALSPGAEFFTRLAFKVRFANMAPEATDPLTWLLSDFERRWYLRWVLERSQTAGLSRKLEALSGLKVLQPDYPEQRAQGVLLFQAGNLAGARQAFEQALAQNPQDTRAQAFLDKVRDMTR